MNPIRTALLLAGTLSLGLVGCDRCDETPVAAAAAAALPAGAKTVIFSVDGMSCGGCASAVDTKVGKVAGVLGCEVSLEERRATVQMTADGSPTEVEEAIRSLGYTVEPETGNPAS